MYKFFKYCLLAVIFIVLTFSIPFSYCADSFDANGYNNDSIIDYYKVINNVNMTKYNDAYYCDILGGIIEIKPVDNSFTANVLSTKRIKLKIDGTVTSLSAHTLYSLSLLKQDDATFLVVNETKYELVNETFSLEFAYIGAFGNFKTEYFTTYHDKSIKLPVSEYICISQGSAKIIDDDLYLYPEPITDASDTVSQYVVYDSVFRLSYYSMINKHCVTESLSIDTDTYNVSEEFSIVNVSTANDNAATEITGNIIKFSLKGEYCITLMKGTYKYVINLTVNIPDTDTEPNPPEPDLPPDDNGNNDDSDIVVPPSPPDNDDILPPDEGEIIPPDNGNDTPPDEDELPPDNDTELPPIDDGDDNNNDNKPPSPPDESVPPDNNNNDNTEPPVPPDESDNLPPDIDIDGDKPDGDISDSDSTPPIEEILPPNSDSSIIDDDFNFNVNYESKIDYAKIIIIAVCAIFVIVGITALAIVVSKIKKRK